MNAYRAIIFDMDGVVVDSEPRHIQAFLEVFREMGIGENHGIDFAAYYGRSDRALWTDFCALHHPPHDFEDLIAWKQRRFIEIIRREKPIFPAIPALLDRLNPRFVLGLASGSVHAVIEEVLALRNLRWYFQAVASIQDVAHPKPAPDVFLRAADLLGVAPGECCVLEDAAVGVDAALSAGMDVIAITNTLPREKLSHANRVVDHYAEIERLLLEPPHSLNIPFNGQGR
jgi:HAD superfamily hydrolase (TIGR01509 family)